MKQLSWSGIPDEFRPLAWKILLGYIPANMGRRDECMERKRKDYNEWVPQYFHVRDSDRSDDEQSIIIQIRKDVPRTHPGVTLFQQKTVQDCIERILYILAIKHPATGYVQGMNDLITPFLVVFLADSLRLPVREVVNCDIAGVPTSVLAAVEADSYWCLQSLLHGIQDHYTAELPGIQRMMFKLKELIHRIDSPLHEHLKAQNVQFIQFAFQWMNCLLTREVPMPLVVRMWDTYLSEPHGDGFTVFHVYVCAALLTKWSGKLCQLEFQEIMLFLKRLPTLDWGIEEIEMLLSQAFMWKTLYNDSQAHLMMS